MSDAELSELEKRTLEAERRLSALEGKMGNGALAVGGVDVQRYISELQGLKAVLLAAKSEQEALENRVQEVSCMHSVPY